MTAEHHAPDMLDPAQRAALFAADYDAVLPSQLAVALSGGSDSLALTVWLHEWCNAHKITLHALHVNHRLRAEADAQAAILQQQCAALGITCHILTIQDSLTDHGNMQANARNARYALMQQWCSAHQVQHLYTAHHHDDQAETIVMRLLRGSGLQGLSGIRRRTRRGELILLRPLLSVPKSAMREYLLAGNHHWIEDPTNRCDDYTRNRVRHTLKQLQRIGLTSAHWHVLSGHAASAHDCLQQITYDWIHQHHCLMHEYYAALPRTAFLALHQELQFRILSMLLPAISGQSKQLRAARISQVLTQINTSSASKITAHGCVIECKADILYISREAARAQQSVPCCDGACWDQRFTVQMNDAQTDALPYTLGMLGQDGLRRLKADGHPLPALPAAILHTAPAVFALEAVIYVPHIDYSAKTCDNSPITLRWHHAATLTQ